MLRWLRKEESVPRKRVAIVVPLSVRPELTTDEQISFRHLRHHLGRYDTYLVVPRGSPLQLPGCEQRPFDRHFFGSAAAHRRLMLSPGFYEAFRDYDFILVYHPDALAFSDQLAYWCDAGYDYIGAPWLRSPDTPEEGFARVGNGGFSLRNVQSFLRVVKSRRYADDPDASWAKWFATRPLPVRVLNYPRKLAKRLRPLNNARREMAGVRYNEDFFWADRARWFYPAFRVAPVEVALRFAFEVAPRYCFEANGRTLPFGCHAWPKYDRAFWEPYLLPQPSPATASHAAPLDVTERLRPRPQITVTR